MNKETITITKIRNRNQIFIYLYIVYKGYFVLKINIYACMLKILREKNVKKF